MCARLQSQSFFLYTDWRGQNSWTFSECWQCQRSSSINSSEIFFFLPQISSGGGLSFFRGSGGMREEKKKRSTSPAKQGSEIGDPPESLRSFPRGDGSATQKEKKRKTVIPQSLNQEEDSWGVLGELGDTPKMVPWSTTVETSCHARCRVTVSQGLTNKLSITRVLINVKKITGDHVAG